MATGGRPFTCLRPRILAGQSPTVVSIDAVPAAVMTDGAAMETDTVVRAGRVGALLAGPLALLSIVLVIAAEVTGAMASMASPAVITASVVALVSTLALLLGLLWLHAQTGTRMQGRGGGAMVIALVGAALTVGANWSMVFPAPAIDARFPGLLTEPLPAVVGGFIASNAILGIGTLLWAVAARRTGALSRGMSTALIVGGLLCITPLPARYIVIAFALTIAARQPTREPVPAAVAA